MTPIPVDPDRCAALAVLLRRCWEIREQYTGDDVGWSGDSGSPVESARIEFGLALPGGTRMVQSCFASAHSRLTVMTEHLSAMARLLDEEELAKVGVRTLHVICRAALETGARCSWMLDPDLSTECRVMRHLADQLHSAEHAEELLKQAKISDPMGPTVERVREISEGLGPDFAVTRNGRHWQVGTEARPGDAAAVRELMRETTYAVSVDMIYPLLCATTHGTAFTMLWGFRDAGVAFGDESVLTKEPEREDVEHPIGMALDAFTVAMSRAARLLGRERTRIELFRGRVDAALS